MSVMVEFNFEHICRSCLVEKNDMECLFTRNDIISPTGTTVPILYQMFASSTGVYISEDDIFPHRICSQCAERLRSAYLFRLMCQESDEKMRSISGMGESRRDFSTQTPSGDCPQGHHCPECQKKFRSAWGLSVHSQRHLREGAVTCVQCGRLYRDAESLTQHTEVVHGAVDLCCGRCQRHFSRLKRYKKHIAEGGCGGSHICAKEEPVSDHGVWGPDVPIKEEPPEDPNRNLRDVSDDDRDDFTTVKEESPEAEYEAEVATEKVITGRGRRRVSRLAPLEEHPCSKCPRVFSSAGHLAVHEAKHVAKPTLECLECGKVFVRSSHLKRHQLTHSSERFQCSSCEKTFLRPEHLERHQWRHTGVKIFKCELCPKDFVKLEDMERHSHTKHGMGGGGGGGGDTEGSRCLLCDREFTTRRYLEVHMKSHSKRAFPCKLCSQVSESKEAARAHTQWHRATERPFLCSECGQGFTRDAYLTVHMRRHRGEKPFSCTYCGKGFPRRSDLDIHQRYHTEDKRHVCAVCGKAFHRQYNLKVHLRVHTGERPYCCPYCSKAFAQPNDLKAHVRRHTGERFACEVCSAAFVHGYHLTQHRRQAHGLDAPSHIRRLSKHPAPPPATPPAPPTRGRAHKAHLQLAAHMAAILAQQQSGGGTLLSSETAPLS